MPTTIGRRCFIAAAGLFSVSGMRAASGGDGRLRTRPIGRATEEAPRGFRALGIHPDRDTYVSAPEESGRKLPVVLSFHGARGDGRRAVELLRKSAEERGFLLVGPGSRGGTWDAILGGFGPDVAAIDELLAWVFARYDIDRSRIVAAGFSDGASYALSLGMTNGDLFTHIMAFSPGMIASPVQRGRPDIFISHGTRDNVLPIERCSRRMVPQLLEAGYRVKYREFDGPHATPPEIRHEALDWLLGKKR